MSQGFLIYAHNTEKIDYMRIAQYNARQITRFTQKPVAVVTDADTPVEAGVFEHVIRRPKPTHVHESWRNAERADFNALTPFMRTVVLDADYLVFSDWLNLLFDSPDALLLSNRVIHVSGKGISDERMSMFGLQLVWATCFAFERDSAQAREFFALCDYVREHYEYFGALYDYPTGQFRNDFVFTVAHHLARGQDIHSQVVALNPRPLAMTNRAEPIIALYDDGLLVSHRQSEAGFTRVQHRDVHVLNKQTLLNAIERREKEQELSC